MINREDMLELTRRMTPARTSFTRVAGCYVDREGVFDGSFNINFLKLSASDRKKNLELAKAIPFSKTNVELKQYNFSEEGKKPGGIKQLLTALKECGLKNDALMDSFYDQIIEELKITIPYSIFMFHDRYDIPRKGTDKERQWESEEVFEYIIGTISPLVGEYEPGTPTWGFLYPAFVDRSGEPDCILIYEGKDRQLYKRITEQVLKAVRA